jgi:hypothetical protein
VIIFERVDLGWTQAGGAEHASLGDKTAHVKIR